MTELKPCHFCGASVREQRGSRMTYCCSNEGCLGSMYVGLDWNQMQNYIESFERSAFAAGEAYCRRGEVGNDSDPIEHYFDGAVKYGAENFAKWIELRKSR